MPTNPSTELANVPAQGTLHTPGPWWVERRIGDALQVNAKHRGEGSSYCVASVNHWEGEADRANALLIAAAPDLLASLKEMGDWIAAGLQASDEAWPDERCLKHTEEIAARARAAVDKAEGRS